MMSMASQAATHLPSLENLPVTTLFENCKSVDQLRQIHAHTIKKGIMSSPLVQNKIVAFPCEHEGGNMLYARRLFDEIPEPSVFVCNTMIEGYSRLNRPKDGVSMYLEMLRRNVKPNDYTFPFLFKGFKRDTALAYGKELHGHVVKYGFDSNVFVQNALVNMYSLSGMIDMASGVFYMSCERDVVTWNVMISGYNRIKHFDESRKLFKAMMEKGVFPTSVTFALVLSACSKLKDLDTGKQVHRYIKECKIQPNLVLENALIAMYAACGEMTVSLDIFENMKTSDVISWTSIITGFANSGQVDLARKYFDRMSERDYVSWTAMIDGYLRVNRFKEALELFRKMQTSKIKPDEFTVVSILTACAHLGALELGEWINTYIDRHKIKKDSFVGNALVDMYFKCGNVEKGLQIFNEMQRDKFTWTAVIVGLAINGYGEEALDMFSQMLEASIMPDEITCVGVLCACTHTGMVDKGRRFFASMINQHGIQPNVAHYGCMVDLLGRAGHLQEAYEVIQNMPVKPNSVVWGALLGACRIHKDAEMAELAAKNILELEPGNSAVYVLLCNIYATCNKLESLRELREMMLKRGIKKIPGCSLIEMNGMVHEFVAGDQSHPQSKEIYLKLEKITSNLKFAGYTPDMSEVFLDVGEEDKESSVYRHSEKLAIAFGLLSSKPGVTIRIVKNLRMCVDCHRMAKLVSKVYSREVIVRDRTRFHHFRHGSCSCKDYWVEHRKPAMQTDRLVHLTRTRDEELKYHRQASTLRSNTIESTIRLGQVVTKALSEVLHTNLNRLCISPQNCPRGSSLSTQIPILYRSISLLSYHQQLPKLGAKRDKRRRNLHMQFPVLGYGDVQQLADVLHPIDEALELVQVGDLNQSRRQILCRVESGLELEKVSPR